jgi:hypothetical protein
MEVSHQEVSCGILVQVLSHYVMSKYLQYYGVSSVCIYATLYTKHTDDSP